MLMMWVGFGGLAVLPKFLQSLPVVVALYLVTWLFAIYVLLAKASKPTRRVALYGVFAPWAFLLIIGVPQFGKEPASVAILCAAAAVVWFLYIPGEHLVRMIVGDEQNT
jgi:hypothetical protein